MKFKRHFRFCRYTNHPAYIVAEHDGCYSYISITHAPYWNHHKCIPIKGLDGKSYLVPFVFVAEKTMFSRSVLKTKFSYSDGYIIRDFRKVSSKLQG